MPAHRSASSVALLWIAVAILGWAVLAPALHADHGDHATACPYCQPAQSGSMVVPQPVGPSPDDLDGLSIMAAGNAAPSTRSLRTDHSRGPPARI